MLDEVFLRCRLIRSLHKTRALFTQVPSVKEPHPIKLPGAESLGITDYIGVAYNAGEAASLPSFALSLDVDFGTLPNKTTFDKLCDKYCGWSKTKSKVQWNATEKYSLLDFLPPVMQAVSGKHWRTTRHQKLLPNVQKQTTRSDVIGAFNCWGYAWEAQRAASHLCEELTIHTGEPRQAWKAFTEGGRFRRVQSSRVDSHLLDPNARKRRNQNLEPGDVLLIYHDNGAGEGIYLDHVATYIDEDLYFERSGSGDRVPFRLNTWVGITQNFPTVVFCWEWRRLNPDVGILESAAEMFGLHIHISDFPLLATVAQSIQKALSWTPSYDSEGQLDAHAYTGIQKLDPFSFDSRGRALLPTTALVADQSKKDAGV